MKNRRWRPLRLLLLLLLCLALLPQLAQAEPFLATTSIDLGRVLNESALHLVDAFVVNEQACALLYQSPGEGQLELIFFDLVGLKALHSVLLSGAESLLSRAMVGETLCLTFTPKGWEEGQPLLSACVQPDLTVTFGTTRDDEVLLPGGQTAILTAEDGSLVAKDVQTGQETLLIKGIPPSFLTPSGQPDYQSFLQYQPVKDDVGYDGQDAYGMQLTLPKTQQEYEENEFQLVRSFHFYQPLSATRFVYAAFGWEWGAGFGVYDLAKKSDHRFTGRGSLFGLKDGKLISTTLIADTQTLQSSPLPKNITGQLEEVVAMEDSVVAYDIAKNGRLLAIAGLNTREEGAPVLRVSDLNTGRALYEAQPLSPDALPQRVAFVGSNRVLLFLLSEEGGPASLQLYTFSE